MAENVQWVKRKNGKLFVSDSFKDKQCLTVVLSFDEPISKKDFLDRYFDLLPDCIDLHFFENEIEFDVETLNGHVPDKLIRDVTQEIKGGD